MQLSLPAANFPTPAAAPACGVKTPAAQTDSPDTPADSFDTLLKKDSPADDSTDDDSKTSTDAEQAAGILAAIMWMQNPAATAPVPVQTPVLPDGTAAVATDATQTTGLDGSTETASGNGSTITSFFGATNSRAFGKVQSSAAQVQVAPFPTVGGGQELATATAGQGMTNSAASPMPQCNASAATAENSVNAAVVTAQAVATVPAAVKSTATTTGKVAAKTAADGKVSVATDVDSDSISDDVITSSSGAPTGSKVVTAAGLADSKGDNSQDAGTPADTQEKFAPLPAVLQNLEKSTAKVVEKYFLDPVQKAVTTAGSAVGIAVAKVNAAMSSASNARTKSASLVEPSAGFVFSADQTPTATLTFDAPAPVATVRETMAAVISAVDALERRADVQQKSVDLNFNVGNEKLGLRVELKDGAVHTTFRTESSEMNSALSREWNSVVPSAVGREIRVADPVFHTVASSGSDSSFTSLGQGAQQQQREQPKAAPTFASALRREFSDSQAQETASPVTSSAANSSQLLNALA